MKTITEREAFCIAVPRRPAVLCLKRSDGGTDMITTEWFNWLNLKRQPMLSYALNRGAGIGVKLETESELFLAFPPVETALKYKEGIHSAQQPLPEGIEPCSVSGIPVLVPVGSEVVLHCTLFNAYNYPFKKIRIFNCNLEKAIALKAGDTRKQLPNTEKASEENEK